MISGPTTTFGSADRGGEYGAERLESVDGPRTIFMCVCLSIPLCQLSFVELLERDSTWIKFNTGLGGG